MRILHVAPLWFPVHRNSAGGIETFLAALLEEQQRLGCATTLIASGDSVTHATLVPAIDVHAVKAMKQGEASEYAFHEQAALSLALELAPEHDVVHCHLGSAAFALSAVPALRDRLLHTYHNEVTPDLEWYIARHPGLWLSTVSETQAARLRQAGAQRCEVVPNGLPADAFPPNGRPGRGLAFLGRIEEAKGADLAIDVARQLGEPLTLAGPIVDDTFFEKHVLPAISPSIRYVGVLGHEAKCELLGSAACTLMPSRCDEGFGMVAVESMFCGTPVVSSGRGALAEVIDDGVTGYSVGEAHLAEAVNRAVALDRRTVSDRARGRFGIEQSAVTYLDLYQHALSPVPG
jgi:glycosyltransferase involved in cell wall biosynthesis